MIFLLSGKDWQKKQAKWREIQAAFRRREPAGEVFRLAAEDFSPARWEELISGQGLFGQKFLVAASGLLTDVQSAAEVESRLPATAAAPHTFVFLEEETSAALRQSIVKAGGRAQAFEFSQPVGTAFNPFPLTDALAARDRKKLWLLYQAALAQGQPAEEIFWRLVWQVKTLLLVKNTSGPPASVKPFVAAKARRALANFNEGELEALSSSLVSLWHETKNEANRDLALSLERLILSV